MIGHGESRTRFLVCYGYAAVSALIFYIGVFPATRGDGLKHWLFGIAIVLILPLLPSWVARYLPGPVWFTPVVIGIGSGLAMFPVLSFFWLVLERFVP